MHRPTLLFLVLLAFLTFSAVAQEKPEAFRPFAEPEFQRHFQTLQQSEDGPGRLHRARELFFRRGLSSAQVRRLAQSIPNEDQRVEFVVSAYHCTVDPENYYEVYDAFQTFSKVFRMHDRLAAQRRSPTGPVAAPGPQPLTRAEFEEIKTTLKSEPFENNRLTLLKVVARKAQDRITSAQLADLLGVFTFENNRLTAAQQALSWVQDPENLYLLYAKFNFANYKDQLTQAITSRNVPAKNRPE